jgi:hypothetical protein
VEFGPFATEFNADESTTSLAVADLVREAYAQGATFVTVQIGRIES